MTAGAATLERQDELERIVAALEAAAGGAGRLVVIEGPPGIGKSQLVQHMREIAQQRGFGRLHATGDELESSMAWAVVRPMVERSVSGYRGEARQRLLAGPAGAALAALDGASDAAPATDTAVARTLHALWWVAADLSSLAPLLISVDDAQWADLPSLRFLAYLSRRIEDLPIAIVIATRPPRDREGTLAELCSGRSGTHISLRPLSQRAVAALSASRGTEPTPEVAAALHAASGGNPLLTGQLLDELQARGLPADESATALVIAGLGPATISRSLLSRLPLDAVQLAATAAVLGRRSDPGLAGELARIHPTRLPEAIDALVAGHVLSGGGGQLQFVHPVVREAVLAELGLGAGAYLQDMADGADGMIGWVAAVMALISTDATDAAQAEIARAREWVRSRGTPLEFGIVCNTAAWLARRVGDVAATEAEADASLAAIAPEDLGPHVIAVRATAVHAAVLTALERGNLGAATELLNGFDVLCGDAPRIIPVTWLREARTLLALACDEPKRAQWEAQAFRDEVLTTQLDAPWPSWRTAAAQTAQRCGEHDEARTLAAEQLELARRWGAASDVGAALRLCARVDAERRLDLLADAVSQLESAPAQLEHARALVDLGEALRVARRRKDAHDPLRRGADIAAACGSTILRQRALDGLAALGDRPRKQMFSGEESLTGSERRVAALAVEGRTNRDIAQELFVSPKTVENHLGRVYIKLGITSRRQLVGALS